MYFYIMQSVVSECGVAYVIFCMVQINLARALCIRGKIILLCFARGLGPPFDMFQF